MYKKEENSCLECSLWKPHIDDMSPEEITTHNLPRTKDNCGNYLCNDGICPNDDVSPHSEDRG